MLLRDVEVEGDRVDVTVEDGTVVAVRPTGDARSAGPVVDGAGGALLPGLHDHHVHLLATAAARTSVLAGPPRVPDAASLARTLAAATPVGGWIRAVGYHESVLGLPDRHALDALRADVPVRMQHRSGALWLLNSAAVAALGLDDGGDPGLPDGVDRDATGRATGRLWRSDDWLATRVRTPPPDLGTLGAELAAYGVTGVSDATPVLAPEALTLLADARRDGRLPQRLVLMTYEPPPAGPWDTGAAKIVVTDHDLPDPDELTGLVTRAHARNRPVAVHCVSRVALALTVAALRAAGTRDGDRVEHAAVAPAEVHRELAALGVTVVTQPSLVTLRGDSYLADVDAGDREALWPHASLLAAGVPVAASSDAPYGDPDPWAGIRAATGRMTASGRALGPGERVDPATALAGYLGWPAAPGGAPRRVRPGGPADLVLLDVPLAAALADPHARHVRLTVIDGRVVYEA